MLGRLQRDCNGIKNLQDERPLCRERPFAFSNWLWRADHDCLSLPLTSAFLTISRADVRRVSSAVEQIVIRPVWAVHVRTHSGGTCLPT